MTHAQPIPPHVGMIQNTMVKTYQGIPKIPCQGQQMQTHPFQPSHSYHKT